MFVEEQKSFDLNLWKNISYGGSFIFKFEGSISQEIITQYLITLDKFLKKENLVRSTKKILIVSIELLQNIFKHSSPYNNIEKFCIIKCIKLKDVLLTEYLNLIDKNHFIILNDRINQLNLLDHNEIKSLYLKILKEYSLTEKNQANLGLLQVYRKTKTKIYPKFVKLNNEYFFYILKLHFF